MEFLNQVLEIRELEKYLADRKGFLHRALKEAIIFEEIEMFEMILTDSKIIFGQELLDCVISMSVNWRKKYMPLISERKECFESIAKFIISDEPNNDQYKKLSDFVFLNGNYMYHMLINVVPAETLDKMIAADGGIRNWMQRIAELQQGLYHLSRLIQNKIIKMDKNVRDQLVEIAISLIDGRGSARQQFSDIQYDNFRNLLERMEEKEVKKVLLRNNGEPIKRFIAEQRIRERGREERRRDYHEQTLHSFVEYISHRLSQLHGDVANNIHREIMGF